MTEDTQIESMVTITGAEYVRLMAENARLRAITKAVAALYIAPEAPDHMPVQGSYLNHITVGDVKEARAVLGGEND